MRRFMQNFFPAWIAFFGGGEQRTVGAFGGERDDFGDAEFGGFLERPFEAVELHEGQKEREVEAGFGGVEFFDQGKFDEIGRASCRERVSSPV